MTGQQILMTGTTGHVGYRTLIEALKGGYKVLAAVRNDASVDKIKQARSTQPYLEQLTFTIVPDITVDGAFDTAVQGVDYIVHVASPLPSDSKDHEASLIRPAVNGTLSILRSALKTPSVKKVVITSSGAAVLPADPEVAVTADDPRDDPEGPYPDNFKAYVASKIKAYNATRRFITDNSPKFDIISVMPTFVIGPHELTTTSAQIATGSNEAVLSPLLGRVSPVPGMGNTVSVHDVAYIHIAALGDSIQGHQALGANINEHNGALLKLDDGIAVVKKHFPTVVEEGILPLNGSTPSFAYKFDASKTEQLLGFKFRTFEEQVIDIVGYYIEAARREKA